MYETAPAQESTAAEPVKKRITDAEFAAARELYELGKQGISELAAELGITRQTLSRRFKDVGAVKGSRAHEVAKAVKDAEMRFAARRADWIEEARVQGFSLLKEARLIGRKIVHDTVRNNASLETIDDDMRALARYNKMLVDNFDATMRILDANNYIDETELPILQIEDLTADRILDHHISTGVLPEDATIEDLNTEVFGK